MPIKESTIKELGQILQEEGLEKDLSQEQTEEIAKTLVGYFDLLANIYHRTKINENNNDNPPTNN